MLLKLKLFVALSTAVSTAAAADTRKLTSFQACGGGFATMTQAMGMTRALANIDALDQITHVGSNSGGNWFASQLFYSASFYGNLTDPSVDLGEFIILWGTEYGAAMAAAVDSGAAWANVIDTGTFSKAHPLCSATAKLVAKLGPLLAGRDMPFWVWLPYVAAMLKPWIADIETATYGTRAMTGLATATLVQQTTLAPDAYLDNDVLATRSITYRENYTLHTNSTSYVVPLGHVRPASGDDQPGWLLNSQVADLSAVTDARDAQPYNLLAPRDPLIVEIASASSSAMGLLTSPTMLQEWTPGSKHPFGDCLPLGAETLSGPMLVPDAVLPTGDAALTYTAGASDLLYRYMDGAMSDNSNAAMTLGRMQAECTANGGVGCEDGFRMIIAGGSCQSTLFYDASHPPGSFIGPNDGGFNNPIPTIFAEAQPAESAFTVYASVDLYNNGSRSDATYWRGTLTTVDNEWYGVACGSSVELLYFTGIYDTMEAPGKHTEEYFAHFCAQTAPAQAAGAAPILQQFLGASQ